MTQAKMFNLTYAVLILILLGLVSWWVYDSYYPFVKPTPLTEEMSPGDALADKQSATKAASSQSGTPPAPVVDPIIKKMLPFDSTKFDQGVTIGVSTITTVDLLDTFSTLAYNTSRDLSDFALWQEAAKNVSRQAIIIDEAVKRGYTLPADESFSPEIISSATVFLENALKNEKKPITLDQLLATREKDFIVLSKSVK
jgi:hypothetical protein